MDTFRDFYRPLGIFQEAADTQLGVVRFITSRGGTPAVGDAGRGPEVKLLSLDGPANEGEAVTVCVSAIPSDQPTIAAGYQPGILTGIARFGNGGGRSFVEFDIPTAETHDLVRPSRGGMIFTGPAGNFELYARDDSLIIPKAGMGNPSSVGGSLVTAFVTRGRVSSVGPSLFRKTWFFAWRNNVFVGMAPGTTSGRYALPPFAASWILMRNPRTACLVRFGRDASTVIETFNIGLRVNLAAKLVPPRAQWVEVVNDTFNTMQIGQIIFNMDFEGESNNTNIVRPFDNFNDGA
jgi:hypothetical protein